MKPIPAVRRRYMIQQASCLRAEQPDAEEAYRIELLKWEIEMEKVKLAKLRGKDLPAPPKPQPPQPQQVIVKEVYPWERWSGEKTVIAVLSVLVIYLLLRMRRRRDEWN